MRELFANEVDRSVRAMRDSGVRFERIAADLDVTVTTLHNWRHPESANVDLETLQRVADYFGWEITVVQRIAVGTGSDSRCSDTTLIDLRVHEPLLALA